MCDRIKKVTRKEIRQARRAPLYEFLFSKHMDLFRRCGTSLYMIKHNGIYIKQGFPGYNDFSTGEHGNPIDFLISYLDYGFIDAVQALNDFCHMSLKEGYPNGLLEKKCLSFEGQPKEIWLPEPAQKPYRNMYAYLMKRGIPANIIRELETEGLVYQEKKTNNIVFLSRDRDYCELRGTYTYVSSPFHGCRKVSPDRFWYMPGSRRKPQMAYVCEAAIDAISLCIIHRKAKMVEPSLYVSIGGVANQKAILRIKEILPVVLAVDNDPAGNSCRQRNSDLPSIVPINKDWNEDLLKMS